MISLTKLLHFSFFHRYHPMDLSWGPDWGPDLEEIETLLGEDFQVRMEQISMGDKGE